MKYGWTLDLLIREVVIAYASLGPIYVLKAEARDGFYSIALRPGYTPKLGLVSPSEDNIEELLAIPITLPMKYNNSRPYYSRPWRRSCNWQTHPCAITSHFAHTSLTAVQRWWSYLTRGQSSLPWPI